MSLYESKIGSQAQNTDDNTTSNNTSSSSSASASALVIAASDKAGMEGIDRARIDAIILRESGNSAYMKQQRKRDEAVNDKIQQMKRKLQEKQHDKSWRQSLERQLEPETQELLESRRPRSTCVVVDMDMFYMACELLTRPDLANVPCCVGTSMISTSNYCARRFGVRSAMAGWIADKLVSELSNGQQRLVHLPSNFDLYTSKSHQVRSVLAEYDPHLRAYSLDEAYLDLGPYIALHLDHPEWTHEEIRDALVKENAKATPDGSDSTRADSDEQDTTTLLQHDDLSRFPSHVVLSTASKIVDEMRQKVKEATGGLTCSAGLASNFMLAKIASDFNKPNGQKVVGPSHEAILEFIHPLPTRKIPGCGRVTDKMLAAFDITTVEQLYQQRALVRLLFTPAIAKFLLRASLGCSSSDDHVGGEQQSERKGISRERTFQSGRPWSEVAARLEDISRKLSSDMQEKNLRAHTMTVKVKLDTFDVLSRSKSMPRGVYLQEPNEMVKLAAELVSELRQNHKGKTFNVRLLGVRCSNFQDKEERVADDSQMNIDQFLCKKRSASPVSTRSRRSVSPISAATGSKVSSSPVSFFSPRRLSSDQRAVSEGTTSVALSTVDAPTLSHSKPSPSTSAPLQDEQESALETPIQQQQQHCPLCGQVIQDANDNDAVNRHIDACLSSGVIRQVIHEESLAAASTRAQPGKKQRLTDFFQTS